MSTYGCWRRSRELLRPSTTCFRERPRVLGSLRPVPKKILVDKTYSSRGQLSSLRALPISISDWPLAYVSAVSKKLMPWSQAACIHLEHAISITRPPARDCNVLLDNVALLRPAVGEPATCSSLVSHVSKLHSGILPTKREN